MINNSRGFIDPDYEFASLAAERKKILLEKDNFEKVIKTKEILNRQFEIDLKEREKQLELIQERLTKAQKTLHLLRYILVTSYYSKKELEMGCCSEDNSNTDLISGRIHPAIRKLIGNDNLEFRNIINVGLRNRNNLKNKWSDNGEKTETTSIEKKRKKKCNDNGIVDEYNIIISKESKEKVHNRGKKKHRIVIGNISKWMPTDSSTHKWMIYVRGPKDDPDISSIVKKVIFHLHPSYQPNDVIELNCAPFHLSRRGWGEFPLRVKIIFRSPLNKPVDVIHNLKLDRTYSGQQTLGNETIVDVFLYNDDEEYDDADADNKEKDGEEEQAMDPVIKKKEEESCEQEHSLAISVDLDHNYCKKEIENVETNRRNLSNIVVNFTVEMLPILFKNHPLITTKASDNNYKKSHPYTALSMEEFRSWIFERRLSAEWFRAKTIKQSLSFMNLKDFNEWNTKSILIYGRAHGFTPLANYKIFKNYRLTKNFNLLIKHPEIERKSIDSKIFDGELDIVGDEEEEKKVKKPSGRLIDPNYESPCSFVRQCAFEVGVALQPEEILPDLLFNSAERVLLQSALTLAENLIRKARAFKVLQGNVDNDDQTITITSEDVVRVLHHRTELNFIDFV